MSRRKKLFWADEGKREICAQATTPGMSVAQVARRYAVNANLIFKWLKDPHFAPDAEDAVGDDVSRPVETSKNACQIGGIHTRSGFVESTVNTVAGKHFGKKQQMRWSKQGAHLMLQTRARTLDGSLRSKFEQWYPGLKSHEETQMVA